MNFERDTPEAIERRQKLAEWLVTLKGPPKPDAHGYRQARNELLADLWAKQWDALARQCGSGPQEVV